MNHEKFTFLLYYKHAKYFYFCEIQILAKLNFNDYLNTENFNLLKRNQLYKIKLYIIKNCNQPYNLF